VFFHGYSETIYIFKEVTIMEKTLEEKVASLEARINRQDEVLIKRGDSLMKIIDNRNDIYEYIGSVNKGLLELIHQQTECIIDLQKRVEQLEQKNE
jgi:hypothetical protein